jgi:hypothetical protein
MIVIMALNTFFLLIKKFQIVNVLTIMFSIHHCNMQKLNMRTFLLICLNSLTVPMNTLNYLHSWSININFIRQINM